MKKENYRTRAYRRNQRNRAIRIKKGISRRIYKMDWFSVDGKYSKGHIGCGCWFCKPGKRFHEPSWEDSRKTEWCRKAIGDYWMGRY